MATTKDYIEYVCERLHGAGGLRYRKMFGEYMVYVNDKPVLLVCELSPQRVRSLLLPKPKKKKAE